MEGSKLLANYHIVFLALILLVVLAFSGSALALTEDFEAFTDRRELNVCACDLTTDHITVHNTGGVTSTFILLLNNEANSWVDVAPQTFYLEPNEVKSVERFIKVPCDARGEYKLNTTIKTLFDTEKELEQTLKVKNCPNVQIIPKFTDFYETCPCSPVQYSFEIINIGAHVETYELTLLSPADGAGLSTGFLVLEPGQKETVTAFINLDCGEYDEKIFTLNVLAQGTGLLGQTDFALNIKKCYDYDLVIGDEYSVCRGVQNVVPFQLLNKANIANEYKLSVDGVDWVIPENETVSLLGQSSASSNLFVLPPSDEEEATLISLSTTSTRGSEEKNKELLFVNELCYDYVLEETEDFFKAAECKTKTHTITLKNTGSRESTYHVDIEGVDWLSPATQSVDLSPGEEVPLVFSGTAPCGQTGDFAENIYITIDSINQTFLEERVFSVFPKESEFLPKIEFSDLKISHSGGETPVKIINTGFSEAHYILSLGASDWLSLDQDSVYLPPGGNTTVLLRASPSEDVVEDVYSGEIIVSLPDEGLEYSSSFLVELKEKNFPPLWVVVLSGVVLISIISILIVLFFVLSKRRKNKVLSRSELKKEPDKIIEKETVTISKRDYAGEKKEKKSKKSYSLMVFIILLLFVLGLGYNAYTAGFFDESRNPFSSLNVSEEPVEKSEEKTEETANEKSAKPVYSSSLISLDRSGVAGSGNRIEISTNDELSLPLTVKNPSEKTAILTLESPDDPLWVVFEKKKALLAPGKEFTTNVKIKPDLTVLEGGERLIPITAKLRGENVEYEEQLALILSNKKNLLSEYWPVLVGCFALFGLLAIIISFFSGRKREEKTPKRKEKETKSSIMGYFVVGLLVCVLLILLGIWSYKLFLGPALQQPVSSPQTNDSLSTTSGSLPFPVSENQEETKITNADLNESLITIDRGSIPGSGNVFALSEPAYVVPVSVKNPTDRIARFTVSSTANESWLVFDRTQILVGPSSVKNVSFTLAPDYSALEKKDYSVYITVHLTGSKIEYDESLALVLKKRGSFGFGYLFYLLAGVVVLLALAVFLVVFRIIKRRKKGKGAVVYSSKKEKDFKKIKPLKTSINLKK